MYKKMLIPTDGSDFSRSVSLTGVAFARQLGAEIVGVFVAPEFQYPIYVEILPPDYPSDREYRELMQKTGQGYLQVIQEEAIAAGLSFFGEIVFSDLVAQKIVETAQNQHCDLIFMGSHGRGGWGQLLLGSVTTKVLSMCEIPALIHRIKTPVK